MLTDFRMIREAFATAIGSLRRRTLMPARPAGGRCRTEGGQLLIECWAKRYSLPHEDVVLLPVASTTTEAIAAMSWTAGWRETRTGPTRCRCRARGMPGGPATGWRCRSARSASAWPFLTARARPANGMRLSWPPRPRPATRALASRARAVACWSGRVRMRSPAGQVSWPPVSLSLALLKPGAPWDWVGRQLASAHQVLLSFQRTLTTMDTRRLYPEAYGATYLAARDAYLTRAPVLVLVLRALAPGSETSGQVKTSIRHELGGDVLCNHLRMPDNPGEALADIAHFAGERTLAELHGRYERDGTAGRLAFYRAALGIGQAGAHRDRAARRGMCTAAR
jgi:hypothetical protein